MTKVIRIPSGTGLEMTLGRDGKLNVGALHPLELKNKPGTIPGCDCNFECNCVRPEAAPNHPEAPKEPREPSDKERLFWFESSEAGPLFGVVPKKFFEEHKHMDDTFDDEMHDIFAANNIGEAMENIFEVPKRFLAGNAPDLTGDVEADDWGVDHRIVGSKDKLIEFLEGLPLNMKYSEECQELFKN